MRYTGIPRHIRKQLIADKKQNEAIQVRKLNKPFPAMTSGDEVKDFVYAKTKTDVVYNMPNRPIVTLTESTKLPNIWYHEKEDTLYYLTHIGFSATNKSKKAYIDLNLIP